MEVAGGGGFANPDVGSLAAGCAASVGKMGGQADPKPSGKRWGVNADYLKLFAHHRKSFSAYGWRQVVGGRHLAVYVKRNV